MVLLGVVGLPPAASVRIRLDPGAIRPDLHRGELHRVRWAHPAWHSPGAGEDDGHTPAGRRARAPAPASGTPRKHLLAEATEFARQGVAALIYDKRSIGYTFVRRSYSELADRHARRR